METKQLFHVPTGKFYGNRKDVKLALGISGTQFKHLWKDGTITVITPKSNLDGKATIK